MRVVVKRMDLSVAGRANLNRGAGVKPLAFRLLTRNQVVFGESGHFSLAKFAGLRHRLRISEWWGTVILNLILAIALPVQYDNPVRITCIRQPLKNLVGNEVNSSFGCDRHSPSNRLKWSLFN